jgi:hypothetical protein
VSSDQKTQTTPSTGWIRNHEGAGLRQKSQAERVRNVIRRLRGFARRGKVAGGPRRSAASTSRVLTKPGQARARAKQAGPCRSSTSGVGIRGREVHDRVPRALPSRALPSVPTTDGVRERVPRSARLPSACRARRHLATCAVGVCAAACGRAQGARRIGVGRAAQANGPRNHRSHRHPPLRRCGGRPHRSEGRSGHEPLAPHLSA